MSATPRCRAAFSASIWRSDLTFSSVMPGLRHSLADSPRSPYDRQTTVTSQPAAACSAMAPPARQTKSAECALTTNAVFLLMRLSVLEESSVAARGLVEAEHVAQIHLEAHAVDEHVLREDGGVGDARVVGVHDVLQARHQFETASHAPAVSQLVSRLVRGVGTVAAFLGARVAQELALARSEFKLGDGEVERVGRAAGEWRRPDEAGINLLAHDLGLVELLDDAAEHVEALRTGIVRPPDDTIAHDVDAVTAAVDRACGAAEQRLRSTGRIEVRIGQWRRAQEGADLQFEGIARLRRIGILPGPFHRNGDAGGAADREVQAVARRCRGIDFEDAGFDVRMRRRPDFDVQAPRSRGKQAEAGLGHQDARLAAGIGGLELAVGHQVTIVGRG